jgi:thymidine kinase
MESVIINNMSNKPNELKLFIGPMFAGKSTQLISDYNNAVDNNLKPLVITHSLENRYSDDQLSSHDKLKINCVKFNSISSFITFINEKKAVNNYDIILFDEAQFFKDILLVVDIVEKYNISVNVYGLDGDFKREKFGNLLDIIPYCDEIIKLKANCNDCHNKAIFSFRMDMNNNDQVLIGSSESYIPLCRLCYLLKSRNK